jgi:methionine-gamma-lyase
MKTNPRYHEKSIAGHEMAPETLMLGYGYDAELSEGSLKPPLFMTSTFVFKNALEGKGFFELAYGLRNPSEGENPGLIYSRINNPNLEVLEDRLAIWDRAEKSLAFASGMAAISTSLWAYLRPGDVILHSEPVYGGTEYLLHNILPSFGIQRVGFMAEGGNEAFQKAADEAAALGKVAAILIETPANPTNGLVDLAYAREQSERFADGGSRPPVIVDNTFLGPLYQTPLDHGADLTITSLTKYVGGHSDLIAGSCSGAEAWIAPVRGMRTILGTMTDPHTAWLLMRSLETLKIRMTASADNARQVAEFLRGHPRVASVWFLDFLPKDHPDRPIFERQCNSAGSTFSFEIHGGESEAFRVLDALRVFKLAVSLGGTESLASHPSSMTHSDVAPADKIRLGIGDGLIRLSIGIENVQDLIVDLTQALEAI